MKKILFLLLLPILSYSQGVKVEALPTTTVGVSGDYLIKDKAAGGSGGTQKISVGNFISTYSITTNGVKTVSLTGAGTTTVTGTSPSFTVTGVAQQTLSVSSNSLTISGGNTVVLPGGSVTGSGTENYFPSWDATGTNLIDNGLYRDNDFIITDIPNGFFVVPENGGFNTNGSNMYVGPSATSIVYGGLGSSNDFTSGLIQSSGGALNLSTAEINLNGSSIALNDGTQALNYVWTCTNSTTGVGNWAASSTGSQTLSVSSNSLTISGGNTVSLPSHTLSISSNTLTIANGNSVALPTASLTAGAGISLTGSSGTYTVTSSVGASLASVNNFRLSLESNTPVSTTDRTNKDTIYAVPVNGNAISLYDGSSWVLYTSSQFSLALGTLTNQKLYDVFCYANSGVPTLEFLVWTNDVSRATALVYQNGVLCKSGDLTRRFLGTFYNAGNQSATATMTIATPCVVTWTGHNLPINAPITFTTSGALPTGITAGTTYYVASLGTVTANTFNISATPGGALINTTGSQSGTHTASVRTYTEDSQSNRFLWNNYNAVPRNMFRSESTSSWNYSTATYRAANNNLANACNFIIGVDNNLSAFHYHNRLANSTAGVGLISGIGLDSYTSPANTNQATNTFFQPVSSATVAATYVESDWIGRTGIGKHFLAMLEYHSASGGTGTWYGASASFYGVIVD